MDDCEPTKEVQKFLKFVPAKHSFIKANWLKKNFEEIHFRSEKFQKIIMSA